MPRITMKANDTLHLSTVGPDCIAPGQEFDVCETDAKSLEKRGLAVRVGEKPDEDETPVEAKAPISATTKKAK